MITLIVGASGATGQLLTKDLLDRGHILKVIVRSPEKLPAILRDHHNLTVITANILDLSDADLAHHVKECDAVASCLGHNLNFKGIYGQPRKLVTDAVRRLSVAIKANQPNQPIKFLLMNTAGNSNPDLNEPISFTQKLIISIMRFLLPPQSDNEQAAEYLRTKIGTEDKQIEWVAIRPDSLTNEDVISAYDVYPSPIRSAIFDPGQTSRINVAHFMSDLITKEETWQTWKGQMPVIYNKT